MKISGFIIFFLALACDQATKFWITSQMSIGQSIPLVKGILQLTFVENPGGAFGVFPYRREFLITTTLLLMAVLFYYWRNIHRRKGASWNALALIFAGASGNLFDRLFNGAVIDFIDIGVWPIFNLADFFIVTGLGVFFYHSFRIQREHNNN